MISGAKPGVPSSNQARRTGSLLEHMVFKGSQRPEAGAFDLRVEALGGSSNAATGFDDVHFHVLVPPDGAQEALELLLDLVLEPALRTDAYAMERDVVLAEIAQYRDQLDEQVVQQLLVASCPTHPYGRSIWAGKTACKRAHRRPWRPSIDVAIGARTVVCS